MKNELDLRRKTEPRIVERIIFQRRPWHMEALKLIIAIVVATGAVYAISKADEISSLAANDNPTKSFSVIGFVSGIADGRLSIERANGSDGRTDAFYSFGLVTVSKIETSDYVSLPASLIRVGDQIIVQGTETDGVVTPTRIVSFARISADDIAIARLAEVIIATSTPDVATSTDAIASSTESVATSTPPSSGSSQESSEGVTPEEGALFASTTPAVIIAGEASTSTDAVASSTESVATSTEPVATSSESVIVPADSTATSTESIATSTEPVMTPVEPAVSSVTAETETEPAQAPVEIVPEPAAETAPEATVIPEPVVEPVAIAE